MCSVYQQAVHYVCASQHIFTIQQEYLEYHFKSESGGAIRNLNLSSDTDKFEDQLDLMLVDYLINPYYPIFLIIYNFSSNFDFKL